MATGLDTDPPAVADVVGAHMAPPLIAGSHVAHPPTATRGTSARLSPARVTTTTISMPSPWRSMEHRSVS